MRAQVFALVAMLAAANVVVAAPAHRNNSLEALARKAVSESAPESATAIEELRSRGPAGLQALLDAYAAEVGAAREGLPADASPDANRRWQRLRAALDRVAAQRDSYASGLY
ncbi:MAG TPA: hypothetical protein VJH03_09905, partial [Blastocatellia bacterium]|nr:hypothetical protein [Blastocatellia bacterium]